ncbi:MAG: LTA synthase family protein [Pyrinomonadaceae bacterium]|nr:LTA synthase family protein [Pyrinomonadaceae bacterium]
MKNLQQILIAFSLANLLFIQDWKRLIYPTNELFHNKLSPYPNEFFGLFLSILLTSFIFLFGFWGNKSFFGEKFSVIGKIMFLLIMAVALNGVKQQLNDLFPHFYLAFGLFFLGIILTISLISLLKSQNFLLDSAIWICLIFSPIAILIWGFSIWKIFTENPVAETSITAQIEQIKPKEKDDLKNRVIWIIFDELDYVVPFEKKPVALPEFEKLKQTSFFTTNAIPPAYSTRDATISLITGKKIEKSEVIGRDDLKLKFSNEANSIKFSETQNIFRQIKSMNGETALVGWVNPYCLLLKQDLSVCQWHSFDTVNDYFPMPLSRIMLRNFQNAANSIPLFSRVSDSVEARISANVEDKGYLARHQEMMKATESIITNPNIDLAFIHLPFPHPPNYYNVEKGDFDKFLSKNKSLKHTYLDNLILTDKVLGEIRRTLEESNLWNNSTIIVSSDHQWRINSYLKNLFEIERQLTNEKEDVRVPFFLKLKNQNESFIYEKPFNTAITKDLILAIVKGEISTAEEVKFWLEKNLNNFN